MVILALMVLSCPLAFSATMYAQFPQLPGYDGYDGYDGDDDGGHQADPDLNIDLESDCEGVTVTVTTDQGAAVSGAEVTVGIPTLFHGYTDSKGEVHFGFACDRQVDVYASHSGYHSAHTFETLIDCGQCEEPECDNDDDCPDNQQCDDGQCVNVPCDCGVVSSHQCAEYECCANSDCPQGQVCQNHECTEPQGCTSDGDCEPTEYCDIPVGAASGLCMPVTGCGEVVDHVLVPYECGDDPNCQECPEGFICVNYECVESSMEGPDNGFVGDDAEFTGKKGDEVCANCDVEVTDPTGQKWTGKTDENGGFVLPLTMEGPYTIVLLENGKELAATVINAIPKSTPTDEGKPTVAEDEGGGLALILILLLLLGIIVVLYLRRGQKGKK
ncbi:carboxypeptidase-like regulatory domain-containing protein [Patescibacteria group bacterium]|nr:carboxypeptidase-like regulatory domain-containing protein [Patescibacteria group bacterium]